MLAKSIEIMIIATLENHVYKFSNEIRRQKAGGPIGLSLTGEIADCYMVNWDKQFMKKMFAVGVTPALYERFKDDITLMLESLEKGLKYVDGKLVMDEDKKLKDEEKSNEEVTMEIIKEIAEDVDEMIKFTVDYPSNHKSGKIPVLDVQANINKQKQNRLDFEFFEKPSKHKLVILSNSAISSSQKRTILTQECLRRMRNTKIELGNDVQIRYLNEFMVKMKNSGYDAIYRKQILDSAFNAYEKMVEADKSGAKPMYRDRDWNLLARKEEKKIKKLNWYKNGEKDEKEYKSVLFVPATKGGGLAKELKKREEELNKYNKHRIKIVEDGGLKMKDVLVQKNPFPVEKCSKKKCAICDSQDGDNLKIACNSNNVGYQLECHTCIGLGKVSVYEGETSRSARIRGGEHWNDFMKKRSNSVIFKHKEIAHKDEEMQIKMKITKKFKDPLTRQANEAVRINNRNKTELLNSRNEFNHPAIPRIMIEKPTDFKKKKYTQSGCGTALPHKMLNEKLLLSGTEQGLIISSDNAVNQ